MKLPVFLSTLLFSVSALSADEKLTSSPIFNGKDLTGWSVKSPVAEKAKAESYWSVVDGAIQVDTKGDRKHDYAWLCYDQELADFELTMKIRTLGPQKGTQAYRSVHVIYLNKMGRTGKVIG